MKALQDIHLYPLGNSFIWNCPLCEYTQGPINGDTSVLTCQDCGAEWALTPAPPPPPPRDMVEWVLKKNPQPEIEVEPDLEDPTRWNVQVSFKVEVDKDRYLNGDPIPPHITYEADVSRELMLSIEDD